MARIGRNERASSWVRWAVVAGIALLLVWTGWVVARGLVARDQLVSAVPLAHELRDAVLDGRADQATALAADVKAHSSTAYDMTHDPIWRVTEGVPWLGANLTAVREVTEVVETITSEVLDPVLAAASRFDPASLSVVNGAVDLSPIIAVQSDIAIANSGMSEASRRAESIDITATVRPVSDSVGQLLGLVREVSSSIDALDRAAYLLPAMLGDQGPRSTLVLIQNNAELRASGGITGALALVTAEAGAVALAGQASSSDFRPAFDAPVLPLDAATSQLYGDITGRYIQDVNLTPWFDTSAQLAQEMWRQRIGGEVDAVVGVDPVLLSYLLEATGPVAVGDVELTSYNVVGLLLSDVYAWHDDPEMQDAFFAAAAQAVFAAVTSSGVDSRQLIEALVRGGEENRIRIWSAHPDEQKVIEGTTLAGLLPSGDADGSSLGVFLNDGTGAKMNFYTEISTTVAMGVCGADGLPTYRLSVTIENAAPEDAADSLPAYVTGGGRFGIPPGSIGMFVSAYGPVGASVQNAMLGDQAVPVVIAEDRDRPVSLVFFELAPGESTTYTVDFLGSTPARGPLQLVHTPTINVIETQHRALAC